MTVLLECICASVGNDCSIKPHYVFAATFAMYDNINILVKTYPDPIMLTSCLML